LPYPRQQPELGEAEADKAENDPMIEDLAAPVHDQADTEPCGGRGQQPEPDLGREVQPVAFLRREGRENAPRQVRSPLAPQEAPPDGPDHQPCPAPVAIAAV